MIRDDASGVDASLPLEFNGIDVSLPLAFGAFCLLHGAHYQAYAQYRLRDADAAEHAVRSALGELLVVWPAALTSKPAEVGWRILRRRVAVALRAPSHTSPDTLHQLVPALAADAAVLHHGLELSADRIAGLMGCRPEHVLYGLATFERHLSQQSGAQLRTALEELRSMRPLPPEALPGRRALQ